MIKFVVEPLEEYRIGLRQSSGIIIENVDVASAFPSPTTILGILGKMLNVGTLQGSGIDDLKDAFRNVMDNVNSTNNNNLDPYKIENPLVWGPLIKDDKSTYTPLFFNKLIIDSEGYVKASHLDIVDISLESLIKDIGIQIRRMNQISRSSKSTLHLFYQKFF